MSSRDFAYDEEYFGRYLNDGRYLQRGDKPWLYGYWRNKLYDRCKQTFGDRRHRLLDLGAGLGFSSSYFARDFDVTGIDIAVDATGEARRRTDVVNFVAGDIERLPVRDRSAECVLAFDVLEHVENPVRALDEAFRVLRPGGWLLMSVPNRASLGMKIKSRKWFGARELPSPRRDETHRHIDNRDTWEARLRRAGLAAVESGTDGYWDAPYLRGLPTALQVAIFNIPSHITVRFLGALPLRTGENLLILARRPVGE